MQASPTGHFKVPTMIIGADVSHAAPGSHAASFAALTVSMDPAAVRYAAAVETNGVRVEMIATKNIEEMLRPLLMEWCTTTGQGKMPKHVYYFRDGVSEGQYQNVLNREVADIKRLMDKMGGKDKPWVVSAVEARLPSHCLCSQLTAQIYRRGG